MFKIAIVLPVLQWYSAEFIRNSDFRHFSIIFQTSIGYSNYAPPKDQHKTLHKSRFNVGLNVNEVWFGPRLVGYRNLIQISKNSRKNVENLVKLHFHLFCLCLHGDGPHVNRCLCIWFVTMACYLYEISVNYIKYGTSNFQKV